MDNLSLPPKLRELEQALAARPRPEPPAALRDRVIGRPRAGVSDNGSRSDWSFAAVVAGAALVWLNLSLSATLATDFGRREAAPGPPVAEVAQQIRQLLPELSEEEALQQARLMRATSYSPL